MIPYERSLVTRMANKPFALLGVNSDKEPDKLKQNLASFRVNWRSFKNQLSQGKAISQAWQVKGWPVIFLIDHKGVIRRRLSGKTSETLLNHWIDELVREAEADRG
jgi:hypothetical protein